MKSIFALASAMALLAASATAQTVARGTTERAMVNQYCGVCHNDKLKSGNFNWSKVDLAHPERTAEDAERAINMLRIGMMPPQGMPRPSVAARTELISYLEKGIDTPALANPNPGRSPLHRLNRTEYANSIKELLAVDIDVSALLPPDDLSHGFDNMADVLTVSPTLMEGYIRAASRISREAVGDPEARALTTT